MTKIATALPVTQLTTANDNFAAAIKLYMVERFEEAAQTFADATRIAPELHPAWAMRAHSLAAVGRTRAAVASMREAIRLAPAIVRYRKALVRYLELLDTPAEIQAELGELRQACANDADAWLFLAETNAKMSRFEQAFDDLQKSQTLGAQQVEIDRVARLLQAASVTPNLEIINPKTKFERKTAKVLALGLKGVNGTVLAGVLTPHYSAGTIDLDVVIVCDRGIFVVECKNYSGSIQGGLNTKWCAADGREVQSSRGINPLGQVDHQVFSMLKRVRTFSPESKLRINGVVLFPDQAQLQLGSTPVDRFDGNSVAAFHLNQLVEAIAEMPRSSDPVCADAKKRETFLEFIKQ